MKRTASFSLLAAALLVVAGDAAAQVRASERALVRQTVNGTVISMEYSRPQLRGRTGVFGSQVRWGEVWTPGANMASVLEVSRDIQLGGQPVPRGRYSVWMVVKQGEWTVLLDSTAERFHTNRPREERVSIRFATTPRKSVPTEVLTWSFPEVRASGGNLALNWDTVQVVLPFTVESSQSLAVPAQAAEPLAGRYAMRWYGPPRGEPAPANNPGMPIAVEVSYRDGSLWGKLDPAPLPNHDTMVLIHLRDDWYTVAWWMKGALFDVMEGIVMEFQLPAGGGKATGFEIRMRNDYLIARGERQ